MGDYPGIGGTAFKLVLSDDWRNPLPKEAEVQYNDAEHRYYLGPRLYRSATQILDQFKEKFDTKERSEYMADRYGRTPEFWVKQWAKETAKGHKRGNEIHGYQEQFKYNRGYSHINDKKFVVFDMRKFYRSAIHYYKMPDGVYPELKLWRHDWGIAGRADKPTFETISGTRFIHIEDYKSNKSIDTSGFNGRMMTGVLRHLPDCEMSHYALQTSLYTYMGEYFGFKPGIRRIIHFPHPIEGVGTPNPKPYELPYLRNEVLAMLEYLKSVKWLN